MLKGQTQKKTRTLLSPEPPKKTPRLHELFRKVRSNFCFVPCDLSQEPTGNCSETLVQMIILFWVFFCSGGFSSCEEWPTRKPDTLAFLQRTPTCQRFQQLTVYECLNWWAPRLLRSGGVLVEVVFLKTVVWQLYCALVLRGCNCAALTTKMATDTFQVIPSKLTDPPKYPDLLFLAFLDFLAFLLFKEFLAFLSVFPFFSKDFRGSVETQNPCFFGVFPCLFPKKQGKEDQGSDGLGAASLKAFFRHSRAKNLETRRHAVYQCLTKPPTR